MRRSEMIEKLVKILDTMPKEASNYHIVDILLGAAESRGMFPPVFEDYDNLDQHGEPTLVFEWDSEDEE